MANYSKYTRVGTCNLFAHFDRTLSNNSNKDIDSTKTHLNYNLADSSESQNELLKKRLSEVKCLKRKDVNVLSTWLVTLPKDFKGDEKAFFQSAYDFLAKKYGQKNVISAYVHKDEKQPHLHFSFVPVVLDKKKNIEKVSAKECVTKLDLISFHKELQDYISNDLGQEVHLLNGATVDGNLTIRELKVAEREKKVESQEKKLQKSQKQVLEASKYIEQEKHQLAEEQAKFKQKIEFEKKSVEVIRQMMSKGQITEKSSPSYIFECLFKLAKRFNEVIQERNRSKIISLEPIEKVEDYCKKARDSGYKTLAEFFKGGAKRVITRSREDGRKGGRTR